MAALLESPSSNHPGSSVMPCDKNQANRVPVKSCVQGSYCILKRDTGCASCYLLFLHETEHNPGLVSQLWPWRHGRPDKDWQDQPGRWSLSSWMTPGRKKTKGIRWPWTGNDPSPGCKTRCVWRWWNKEGLDIQTCLTFRAFWIEPRGQRATLQVLMCFAADIGPT